MRRHDQDIKDQFKEDMYALSFDKRNLRIILRLNVDLCDLKWSPPAVIEKKVKAKLKDLKHDGQIEYYTTHFKKLKDIWKMVRKEEYWPDDKIVRMTLAHCGRKLEEITVSHSDEQGSFAELSVSHADKLTTMGFALFRTSVFHALEQSRIKKRPSDSCLRYILLKIRHERKNQSYLLFESEPQNDYGHIVFTHPYYGYLYLYIDEIQDNEHVFGLVKEEIEAIAAKESTKVMGVNYKENYEQIKKYLFNKSTAFGLNLPFDFLLTFPTDNPNLLKSFKEKRFTSVKSHDKGQAGSPHDLQASNQEGPFSIEINISPDENLATVSSVTNMKQLSSKDMLLEEITKQGVVYGYERFIDKIYSMISQEKDPSGETLAIGISPEPGQTLYLQGLQETLSDKGYKPGVAVGDCVAEMRYKEGTPGSSVTGKEQHAIGEVKDSNVILGEGVEIGSDNRIYATFGGMVKISPDSIYIQKTLIHKGDFSPKFGVLESKNAAIIEGNVEKGSELVIKGDLTIKGALFSDKIQCEGNLYVEGGILGEGLDYMEIGGDIKASYLDQMKLMCHGNLNIEEYIIRSHVVTAGDIQCIGIIANSTVYTSKSLKTKDLGDDNNNPTQVVVGVIFKDLKRLNNSLARIEKLNKIKEREESRLKQAKEHNNKIEEKKNKKKKINTGFYDGKKEEPISTKPIEKYLAKADRIIARAKMIYEQRKRKLQYNSNAILVIEGILYSNVSIDVEKKFHSRDKISASFFCNADSEGNKAKPLTELPEFISKYSDVKVPGEEPVKANKKTPKAS